MLKVRTMRWWVCHNPNKKGTPCNAANIEHSPLQEQIGSDEVGMRVQCGKSERKQGETEGGYQERCKRVRRLEEFIREQIYEDEGVAATKGCEICGVKKALSPYQTAIISTPEVLILRLEYFGNDLRKPSKLLFRYGLWLDLSEFQTSMHRRKRKIQALLSPVPLRIRICGWSLCGHSCSTYWYLGSQRHLSQASFNQGHTRDRERRGGGREAVGYLGPKGHTRKLGVCALLGLFQHCGETGRPRRKCQ